MYKEHEMNLPPILFYDPSPEGIIDAAKLHKRNPGIPERCVLCFFDDVIERLAESGEAQLAASFETTAGPQRVYRIEREGRSLALVHPGIGGPMAALTLERMAAIGCRSFIAVGGAGSLDPEMPPNSFIVPDSAIRDEGTSYHYLPAGEDCRPGQKALAAIEEVLKSEGLPFAKGRVWTTDAFYRETPAKVEARRRQGAIAVEMEAASFFAVAKFRGLELAQLLYAGDLVRKEGWEARGWMRSGCRAGLLELAAKACAALP